MLELKTWKYTKQDDPKSFTFPLLPSGHLDIDGEGGVLGLVVMHQGHIPAPEGLLGGESDLRLGESTKGSATNRG